MSKPSQGIVTLIAFATLSAAATSVAAQAEDAASPSDATVVRANDDGFPDLKAAYDTLYNSRVGQKMLDSALRGKPDKTTLSEKRAILRDPAAQSALALLHTALAMPRLTPPNYLGMYLDVIIRLLATQQYVQFADGKPLAAIDTLSHSFEIGNALVTSVGAGAASRLSFKERMIESTATHIDQLSARDSAYLFSEIRRDLAQPDPFVQECEAERRVRESEGIARFEVTLKSDVLSRYLTPAIREDAANAVASNPTLLPLLEQAIRQGIDAYYDNVEARYQAYPSVAPDTLALSGAKSVSGSAAADQIVSHIVATSIQKPGIEQFTVEREMRGRACQRLLAVHAAIIAYRWEHNRVPDSLADLKLGDLALDPFSAQPFHYTRTSDRSYTLVSVGVAKRVMDGNGNFVADGRSVPISLMP